LERPLSISQKDVLHVLALARLRIPDTDLPKLTQDLEAILGHVELLGQAELAGVEAMGHAVPATLPLREDERMESLGPKGLEGSAGLHDRFIRVPKIVE